MPVATHDANLGGSFRSVRFHSVSSPTFALFPAAGSTNVEIARQTDSDGNTCVSLFNTVVGGAAAQGAESTTALSATGTHLVTATLIAAAPSLSAELYFGLGPATGAVPVANSSSILAAWRNTGAGYFTAIYNGANESAGQVWAMQKARVAVGVFPVTNSAGTAQRRVVLFRETDSREKGDVLEPFAFSTLTTTAALRIKCLLNRYNILINDVKVWTFEP